MTQSPTQDLRPVFLKLQLHQTENDWTTALEIPYDAFPRYSSKPRAWMDYLGYAITASDGVLSLSSGTTDSTVACDLNLPISPGEVYFFRINGSVAFVDPHVLMKASSYSSSFCDSDFRPTLIQRDRRCVFTMASADNCRASHLVAFRKGDEYIRRLTEIRSGGKLDVNSIDDPRNGLLISVGPHALMRYGDTAFLPTPIRSLKSCDVAGAVDAEPDTYRLTIQSFAKEPLARVYDGLDARLRSPLPDHWPAEVILTAIYAVAAIKAWGPLGFIELLSKTTESLYYPDGFYEWNEREEERKDKQRTDRREARGRRRGLHGTELDELDVVAILCGMHNGPALERAKRAAEAEAK